MSENQLQKARDYLAEKLPLVPAGTLPAYHVTGGVGWINDPNGFSVYRGEYHLFFQYYPYDTIWGPMHWGHVKTKDFVRWEQLPPALAPGMDYDRDGCFSGSAVELPDGRHLLMYTGVHKKDKQTEWQTQCLAVGDGVDYVKYEGNPVLDGGALPKGNSTRDFRDPKLWREGDRFYAVAGNRGADGSGEILLFESGDAIHWRLTGLLAASRNELGRMWECPDFFQLDGKSVLLTSPQEMTDDGLEFHDGYGTLCLIGEFDGETRRLIRERAQAIDYGLDFYAPQTLETPDGRRVMIAWLQDWTTADFCPEGLPFHGQMTIPRELRLRDGRLLQTPVRELEAYRGAAARFENFTFSGETELPGVKGRILDLNVTVRPADENAKYRLFRLDVARGGDYVTSILCDPGRGAIRIERRSGFPEEFDNAREFLAPIADGKLRLRVLLDRYSMELFVNDGERAASWVLYAPREAEGIRFFADGAVRMDVEAYELNLG